MNLVNLYLWIKAIHIAAAMLFFGGVMTVSAFLWSIRSDNQSASGVAAALKRWDHAVTTPAMLLVWALGLGLAMNGHWFNALWLNVKLFLVIVLSAAHGIQSGQLRNLTRGKTSTSRSLLPMIFISLIGIVVLVVLKPQ